MDFLKALLPNPVQAASLFRSALQIAGTYLATKGVVGGETWEIVSGILLTAATTAYGSLYARTTANVVASAASLPEVKQIIAKPEIADAVPDRKVVAN